MRIVLLLFSYLFCVMTVLPTIPYSHGAGIGQFRFVHGIRQFSINMWSCIKAHKSRRMSRPSNEGGIESLAWSQHTVIQLQKTESGRRVQLNIQNLWFSWSHQMICMWWFREMRSFSFRFHVFIRIMYATLCNQTSESVVIRILMQVLLSKCNLKADPKQQ